MTTPYTQDEVDAIRKDFEGNPYWRLTGIDVENRRFYTESTGITHSHHKTWEELQRIETGINLLSFARTFMTYAAIILGFVVLMGVV